MSDVMIQPFAFALNVAGVSAANGARRLPSGFYKVTIESASQETSQNTGRVSIKFGLKVCEGEYQGVVRTARMNVPQSDDDKVRAYWRTLLESVGYAQAALEQGSLEITQDTFNGKTAYIKFTEKDEAAGIQYDKIDFRTFGAWDEQRKMAVAAPGSAIGTGAAAPANASLVAPPVNVAPVPATPVVSSAATSVLAQLKGLNGI
jgi:hypothetical protein